MANQTEILNSISKSFKIFIKGDTFILFNGSPFDIHAVHFTTLLQNTQSQIFTLSQIPAAHCVTLQPIITQPIEGFALKKLFVDDFHGNFDLLVPFEVLEDDMPTPPVLERTIQMVKEA